MVGEKRTDMQNRQSAVIENTPPELLEAEKQAAAKSYKDSKHPATLTRKICHQCLYRFKSEQRNTKPPQFAIDTDPSVRCPVCGGELTEFLGL